MVSVVLFDFGGTLDADGLTWKDRFQSLCEQEGLRVPQPAFDRAFYDADDALVGTIAETTSFHETIVRLANLLECGGHAAAIAARFERDAIEHLHAAATLLRDLRTRYRIGIVSNFYGNLAAVCAEHGIEADVMIDSVHARCSKPDPEIFFAALRPLACDPGDALFVGDSPQRDMAGARAIGMPHVRIAADADAGGCCPGDRVIRRLGELREILP